MMAVWAPFMVTCAVAIAASVVTLLAGQRELSYALDWVAFTAYAAATVVDFLAGRWVTGALGAAFTALWFWGLWRRHRKNRKRSPRAYGAKSRALLAALVRKAREAAQPRRVLRPVPGGAR